MILLFEYLQQNGNDYTPIVIVAHSIYEFLLSTNISWFLNTK